jgi:hypothetical protein
MGVTRREWIIDEGVRASRRKPDLLRRMLFVAAIVLSVPFLFLPRALMSALDGEGCWISAWGSLLLEVRAVDGMPVQIQYDLVGWLVVTAGFLVSAVPLVNQKAYAALRWLIVWSYCFVEKRVKRLLAAP